MNWIQENKFLAGFFAVILAGAAVLGYLLFAAIAGFDDATAAYNQQAGELKRLQNLPLSPNKKNLDALIAQKKEAIDAVAAFQASLAAKAFPLEPMTPEKFQDTLKATKTAVLQRKAGTEIPDKFFLGFDVYEARPPAAEAAAALGRELKVIDWVLDQLFENHVTKLESLKRDPLPEESGRKIERDRSGKSMLSAHSFELRMQCRQNAFAEVLNALVGTKAPQFLIPRIVQVKNPKTKVPKTDPNAFVPPPPPPAQPIPGTPGAPATPHAITPPPTTTFVPRPPEPPVATPPPAGPSRYILGEEQLEVTLVIDIVDFAQPATPAPR